MKTNFSAEKYEEWYQAICNDDRCAAAEIFETLSPEKQVIYANIEFSLEKKNFPFVSKQWLYVPRRALFLAAIYNSYDILNFLNEKLTDFTQQDSSGDNVIHSLIYICYDDSKQQHDCIEAFKYLTNLLPSDKVRKLLITENKYGLRPLELAIYLSCIQFFNVIFETESLYKTRVERIGVQEYSWYDITDYETETTEESRIASSPMRFMTGLDESVVEDGFAEESLQLPTIKQWYTCKLKANIPFLILWCLIRVCHIVMFYISISAGGTELAREMNVSESTLQNDTGEYEATYTVESQTTGCSSYIYYSLDSVMFSISSKYLIVYGCLIVIYDVAELITNAICYPRVKWRNHPTKSKRPISNNLFYR